VTRLLDQLDIPPAGAVEVVGLRSEPNWIGLELRSPWLLDVTTRFEATHRLDPGDDALRPKDWLHLSLAYGVEDLSVYAALVELIDPDAPAGWEIGLWERLPVDRWRCLT
jgi:hypothetical protein